LLGVRRGNAVSRVQRHLADPAQQIEKRDARIRVVVIDPFGDVDLPPHEREELVECPVVEGDGGQRHDQTSVIRWLPDATSTFSPTGYSRSDGRSTNAAAATCSTPSVRSITANTSEM